MRRGRPWVILKTALSLDGKAAAASGRSRWVTGPEARAAVHAMRAECDAILVGAGTVLADDPALTAHGAGRNPLRVVLAGRRPLRPRARVFDDAAPTVVYRIRRAADLRAALKDLAREGVGTLLVEGGPTIHASFLRAGLVDEARVFIAPKLLVRRRRPEYRAAHEDAARLASRRRLADPGNALMFTGIINVLGKVEKREGAHLIIRAGIGKPALGASIAINGVCLTVVATKNARHEFEVGPETWARTSLGSLKTGSPVNVETSLKMGDEIGGHFVSGHVDATSKILEFAPWDKDFWRLRLELPKTLRGLVAEKGSIAVDGVSLTVTENDDEMVSKSCWCRTRFRARRSGGRKPGDRVNLEADPLARYAANAVRR